MGGGGIKVTTQCNPLLYSKIKNIPVQKSLKQCTKIHLCCFVQGFKVSNNQVVKNLMRLKNRRTLPKYYFTLQQKISLSYLGQCDGRIICEQITTRLFKFRLQPLTMSTPRGVEHDQGGVDASQLSIEGSILDKFCLLTLARSSMIDILQALIEYGWGI